MVIMWKLCRTIGPLLSQRLPIASGFALFFCVIVPNMFKILGILVCDLKIFYQSHMMHMVKIIYYRVHNIRQNI